MIAFIGCGRICDEYPIEIGAGLLVILAGVLWMLFRARKIAAVNTRRRLAGLEPLRWRAVDRSQLRARALRSAGAPELLAEEREHRRQLAWEKREAFREVTKFGRPVTRAYCRAHDRFCLRPDAGAHPPGGIDNPRAPDDFAEL